MCDTYISDMHLALKFAWCAYLYDYKSISFGVEKVVGAAWQIRLQRKAELNLWRISADVSIASESVQLQTDVNISTLVSICGDVSGDSRTFCHSDEPIVTGVQLIDKDFR